MFEDVNVGQRLLALRQSLGLSQRELARRAGVPNGNLSLIEQGKVSPTVQSLQKILAAVGVPLSAFFADSGDFSTPIIDIDQFLYLHHQGCEWWLKQCDSLHNEAAIIRLLIEPGATAICPWQMPTKGCYGFLMQGTLSFSFGASHCELSTGQGVHLMSLKQVGFTNIGSDTAHMAWFLTPNRQDQ